LTNANPRLQKLKKIYASEETSLGQIDYDNYLIKFCNPSFCSNRRNFVFTNS